MLNTLAQVLAEGKGEPATDREEFKIPRFARDKDFSVATLLRNDRG
jgi:hypothetical protein